MPWRGYRFIWLRDGKLRGGTRLGTRVSHKPPRPRGCECWRREDAHVRKSELGLAERWLHGSALRNSLDGSWGTLNIRRWQRFAITCA